LVPIVVIIDWPTASQNVLFQAKEVARQPVLDIVWPLLTNPHRTKPASVHDRDMFQVHDVFKDEPPRASQFVSELDPHLHRATILCSCVGRNGVGWEEQG